MSRVLGKSGDITLREIGSLVPNIIESIAVVGIPLPVSEELLNPVNAAVPTVVREFFPVEFEETSLKRDLPLFCFPEKVILRKEKTEARVHHLVLTDDKSQRLYVSCLISDEPVAKCIDVIAWFTPSVPGDLYAPRCLSIVSKQPLYATFRSLLCSIAKASPSSCIEFAIAQLVATPLPTPGLNFRLQLETNEFVFSASALPIVDFPLHLVFNALSLPHILALKALTAILMERKILFVSASYSLLSLAAEAITSFMYPLYWPHVFIPIVPEQLLECLEAPTPFIMGVHASYAPRPAELPDVVFVDLDHDEVRTHKDTIPKLPEGDVRDLHIDLYPHLQPELRYLDVAFPDPASIGSMKFHEMRIRKAFFSLMQSLLRRVVSRLEGVNAHGPLQDSFYTELRAFPEFVGPFFESFLESQALRTFIEKDTNRDPKTLANLARLFTIFPSPTSISLPVPAEKPELRPPSPPFLLRHDLLKPLPLSGILSTVSEALSVSPSAPLYLYRARLLLKANENDAMSALRDVQMAAGLDLEYASLYATELCQAILLRFTLAELEAAAKIGPFVKHLVGHQRRHLLEESQDGEDEGRNLIKPREAQVDLLTAVSRLQFPLPECRMSKQNFAIFGYQSGITPDEETATRSPQEEHRLFEAFSRLGPRKLTIRTQKIAKLAMAVKAVYSQTETFIKMQYPLEPRELVFMASEVTFLSGGDRGERGSLLLTDSRLLFHPKNKKVFLSYYHKNIKSIEKFNYKILMRLSQSMPGVKAFLADKTEPIAFVPHASAVDPWIDYLSEVASELSDYRYLKRANTLIVLSICVSRLERRLATRLLDYVNYRESSWFKLAAVSVLKQFMSYVLAPVPLRSGLRTLGILNLGGIVRGDVSPRVRPNIQPLRLAKMLLEMITDLMYAHVKLDGVSIGFEDIEKTAEYAKFTLQASSLSKCDLGRLDPEERFCFFVNVYNTLVLHAYVVCKVIPKNFLEWRYFCVSAYYNIAGSAYSLDDILHGVLRGNQKLPYFNETERFLQNDPRRIYSQPKLDPRLYFLLCHHFKSSPYLFILEPETLPDILRKATSDYLNDHVEINVKTNEVILPELLNWYEDDLGSTRQQLLEFLSAHMPRKQKQLEAVLMNGIIRYRFDWSTALKPFRQLDSSI